MNDVHKDFGVGYVLDIQSYYFILKRYEYKF
jgi:hypothetical protein